MHCFRLCGLALATAVFAACTPVVATHSPGGRTQTLHVALPGQPNTLDPLIGAQFYENYLDEAIFSGLTVIDDKGNIVPDLAQTVPSRANGGVSPDGRTLVYRLRPGVLWQDGVPLTAADVVFTFARMR